MKTLLQLVFLIVLVAGAVAGAHYFAEREYARRAEVAQLRDTVGTLQDAVESLSNAHADLSTTYVSKSEISDRIDDHLTRSLRAYHSVDIELGPLPLGRTERLIYRVPDEVPDSAREILVYAYVETGYVRGGARDFKIAVRINESTEAAFYLHAFAQPQSGRSYASDNVWLPMPEDRNLEVESSGEALFGDWDSNVTILAYR